MGPACESYLDALKKCALFDGIGEDDIKQVLNCMDCKIVHYRKNDYIALTHQELDGVAITLRGEVTFVKETYSGKRVIVYTFREGEMFGELLLLSPESQWKTAVQAMTDSSVVFINLEKIFGVCENACSRHKDLLANLVRLIAKRAYDLSRKVEYLSLKSINGKLSRYLLEQSAINGKPMFKLPLNRERLADFLNVSRPSMSRELSAMRDKGIIDFYGDLVRIKDAEKLKELLEE